MKFTLQHLLGWQMSNWYVGWTLTKWHFIHVITLVLTKISRKKGLNADKKLLLVWPKIKRKCSTLLPCHFGIRIAPQQTRRLPMLFKPSGRSGLNFWNTTSSTCGWWLFLTLTKLNKVGSAFFWNTTPLWTQNGPWQKNPSMVFWEIAILRSLFNDTRSKLTDFGGEITKRNTFESDLMQEK